MITLMVSVWLNGKSGPPIQAQLDIGGLLPDSAQQMPVTITGRLIGASDADALLIDEAQSRIMILNQTQVRYSFTFSSDTYQFTGKRV